MIKKDSLTEVKLVYVQCVGVIGEANKANGC